MAASLLALFLMAAPPITLEPAHDVWVYPHAADASKDAYLRVWGTGGKAAPADTGEAEEFSLSYLKWNLTGLPSGKALKSAKLVLTNIANPGFTLAQAKLAPIQARAIGIGFDEKTWTYDGIGKLLPDAKPDAVFGTGAPEALTAEKTVEISVDLLKGPADFRKALAAAAASPTKELALALTSPLDMSALGRAGIYKLYSKDADNKEAHPKLVLEFED
ncbi:MAG: hypothetical protein ACO1SV_05670 [Fimbriimonas sp.]